jgi:hypothetical protein
LDAANAADAAVNRHAGWKDDDAGACDCGCSGRFCRAGGGGGIWELVMAKVNQFSSLIACVKSWTRDVQ